MNAILWLSLAGAAVLVVIVIALAIRQKAKSTTADALESAAKEEIAAALADVHEKIRALTDFVNSKFHPTATTAPEESAPRVVQLRVELVVAGDRRLKATAVHATDADANDPAVVEWIGRAITIE